MANSRASVRKDFSVLFPLLAMRFEEIRLGRGFSISPSLSPVTNLDNSIENNIFIGVIGKFFLVTGLKININ